MTCSLYLGEISHLVGRMDTRVWNMVASPVDECCALPPAWEQAKDEVESPVEHAIVWLVRFVVHMDLTNR
ncbi:hypothetical protein LCGC14_1496180 [marine sediment metagenome]|uniref:Uncharacterized protein n=1 Tax=marine sediment metagenome TaxID=412755 RepID=A0A0F9J5D9_9ZZZZ